jgi:pyrroloquinoline quinone (PQQ) biosynthesis protein C
MEWLAITEQTRQISFGRTDVFWSVLSVMIHSPEYFHSNIMRTCLINLVAFVIQTYNYQAPISFKMATVHVISVDCIIVEWNAG